MVPRIAARMRLGAVAARGCAAARKPGNWLCITAALLLAACVGLDAGLEAPPLPAEAGYLSPREAAAAPARAPAAGDAAPTAAIALGQAVAAQWWALFRSPALDRLVQQAVGGSRTLESARQRLTAAQATLAATRSALYPQLGLSADIIHEKESAATFGLPASALPLPANFTLLQVGPTAGFTLDLFGGTRSRVREQAALADIQRSQLDATYLTLTGNTVLEAIQLAAARAQLRALGAILRIDRQNLELVGRELRDGAVPESDVVSARTQLAADQVLQPGLEQQLSLATHALAVLLGLPPAHWTPPDLDLAALMLPQPLPVGLPSALIHQRPDILAAEAQLRAAGAQIGIATAALYPEITLSAGAGGTSLNGGSLFDPAGLVWSIAAGLTQPLFDAGMRRAQRRAALANFKASAADYQQTVLQAFAQVADILQSLRHDASLLGAQRQALDAAGQSVELQRLAYEKGGAGILTLLDAQRQYQQALLGRLRAQAQRYLDAAQLQVAMGGGAAALPPADALRLPR